MKLTATLRVVTGLRLGSLEVPTPVVLAPMAGITNAAYRRLCRARRRLSTVCEMITSRGLVEGRRDDQADAGLRRARDGPLGAALRHRPDVRRPGHERHILCEEYDVAHVDLNSAARSPRSPGAAAAALPWKRNLLGRILGRRWLLRPYDVPVTMKTRKGPRRRPPDLPRRRPHRPGVRRGGDRAARSHGRAGLPGAADWDAIAALVDSVDIPVLGNGDIWEAADAVRMVEQTGVAGVVVGRGCLGRPWLFRDLAAAFSAEGRGDHPAHARRGRRDDAPARRAAERAHGEERGCKEFRKHVTWYLRGFRAGGELRRSLGARRLPHAALDRLLAELDPSEPFPVVPSWRTARSAGCAAAQGGAPEGWLDDTGTACEGGLIVLDANETTGG